MKCAFLYLYHIVSRKKLSECCNTLTRPQLLKMEKFHRFKPNCTLPDDVPVGFVNAPNIRTTMQIIWSCFSVILLCTWSILRPNVPPELKTKGLQQAIYKKLFLLSRKVYWAGVMLIAPEFLTTFTTKKMFGTKENVAKLKELAGDKDWGLLVSIREDSVGIENDIHLMSCRKRLVHMEGKEQDGRTR